MLLIKCCLVRIVIFKIYPIKLPTSLKRRNNFVYSTYHNFNLLSSCKCIICSIKIDNMKETAFLVMIALFTSGQKGQLVCRFIELPKPLIQRLRFAASNVLHLEPKGSTRWRPSELDKPLLFLFASLIRMQSSAFKWLTIESQRVSRTPEMAKTKTVGMTRTSIVHKTHWVLNYDNSIRNRQLPMTTVAEILDWGVNKKLKHLLKINSPEMRTINQ